MQTVSIYVLFLAITIKSTTISFYEHNFLYHFSGQHLNRFAYQEAHWHHYIFRIRNQIALYNEIFKDNAAPDMACIVEWNGNPASRVYIPTPNEYSEMMIIIGKIAINQFPDSPIDPVLLKRLESIFLFYSDEYLKNNTNITYKSLWLHFNQPWSEPEGDDKPDFKDGQRWYNFSDIRTEFEKFKLLKMEQYKWDISPKSHGNVYTVDKLGMFLDRKNSVKESKKPKQSILFLVNTNKYTCTERERQLQPLTPKRIKWILKTSMSIDVVK
jgi:hypothetical protein